MNKTWSVEFARFFSVLVLSLLIGYATGQWTISIIVALLGYILWLYLQLKQLETWICIGLKADKAPNDTGIWQALVQQLHRQNRARKTEKERLTTILRQHNAMASLLPYGIVILNQNFEILWCNPAATNSLGIRRRDYGQNLCNFVRHPEFKAYIRSTEHKKNFTLRSPVDTSRVLSLETLIYHRNQRMVIARDITDRVALQETRKLFVANASHELKTPLTVILGYLEIFSTSPELPQSMVVPLDNTLQQATRMQSIVEDLLMLSMLENKPLNLDDTETLNVSEKLEQFVVELEESGKLTHHSIEISADADLTIDAIEVEFSSVFENLIGNAIKHTPPGTHIKASWYQHPDSKHICLGVSDSGPGIADKDLPHILERFFRGESQQQVKGTGLGLSIVKHIIERYNGHLDVTSEPGQGTTFTACFPSSLSNLDNPLPAFTKTGL